MGDKRALVAIDTHDGTPAAHYPVVVRDEVMRNGLAGAISSAEFYFGEPVEA